MDLPERVYHLVKADLYNVLSLRNKYNVELISWYWRVDENEEEWIDRLVKLSIERKEVRGGFLLAKNTSLSYVIPLDGSIDEVVINISENMQQKEITTPYELLFDTLETLVVERST